MLKWTFLFAFAIAACGPPPDDEKAARIEVRLIDAPSADVTSIVVTIDHVDAHTDGGGWQTLVSTPQTLDLLTLRGGTFATLGIGRLPAGKLTQLRLVVSGSAANYAVTSDGTHHALTIPSGTQSGIKLTGPIDLPACSSAIVTLDFDGQNSLMVHPGGGDFMLRPVVRIAGMQTSPGTCGADGGETGGNPPPDAADGGETGGPGSGG